MASATGPGPSGLTPEIWLSLVYQAHRCHQRFCNVISGGVANSFIKIDPLICQACGHGTVDHGPLKQHQIFPRLLRNSTKTQAEPISWELDDELYRPCALHVVKFEMRTCKRHSNLKELFSRFTEYVPHAILTYSK